MRYLLCALLMATAVLAQNPPANPPTTSTDPTGKACTATSVLNYIPSGQLFTCKNGVYTSSGGGAPSGAAGGYLSGTYPNPAIKYQWQNSGFTGIGPTSFTPARTLDVYDATAATGNTSVFIKDGAGQSGPELAVLNASNQYGLWMRGYNILGLNAGSLEMYSSAGQTTCCNARASLWYISSSNPYLAFASTGAIWFGSGDGTSNGTGTMDTGISRVTGGVFGIGNGLQGDISGSIDLASVSTVPTPTTQSGTAGTASCSTGLQGTQKYTTCYLAAYANTSTAQTYAFPVAFATTPVLQISGGSCGTFNPTASASTLTLPANAAMTAESCNISVLGQ